MTRTRAGGPEAPSPKHRFEGARGSRRAPLAAAAALTALVLTAPAAQATYPGQSGEIALARLDRFDNYQLWAVNPKSRRTRRLTSTPQRCSNRRDTWIDEQPSYSASGRWIVYHHVDDCFGPMPDGIYRMRSNGTGRRLLVRPRGNTVLDWPALSPSGRLLAWGALGGSDESDAGRVYVAPVSRLARRVAVPGERTFDPAWSSNGRLLATAFDAITMFDASGRQLSTLTASEGMDFAPDWSPDGSRIAFYRVLGGERGEDVYLIGADGRGLRRFTASRDAEDPVWSPDGRRIAFIRDRDLNGTGSLFVKPARGGRARLVLRNVDADRLSWRALR